MHRPRRRAAALALALCTGLYGFALCRLFHSPLAPLAAHDFTWSWAGARHLLAGVNPYTAPQPAIYEIPWPLLYPLPAVLAAVPVARFDAPLAGALFFGASSALLGVALAWTRRWWAFAAFVSPCYLIAAGVVQWAPLVMAATLLPWLGGLLVVKPNIGLAGYCYRPTWRSTVGCVVVLALSLAVLPSWPRDWLAALGHAQHRPPILVGAGVLLALAALRWRTAEGRYLLASACVPRMPYLYDVLPLWLLVRDRLDVLVLLTAQWIAFVGMRQLAPPHITEADMYWYILPWTIALGYLPALIPVLRRPNRGELPVPPWLACRLPAWLTGGVPEAGD